MTIAEYAVRKRGVMKGSRVVAFVCQWTMASQALGRPITLEDYREWWRESERTVYRHQAAFRDVFGIPTPQPFADQAIVRAEALAHGVKGVGSISLDLVPGVVVA
jgi:hypothetical protein